jgi:quercetin dioxygenase-like cupin family protein
MLEIKYDYTLTNEKTIERIIDDTNINLNHMILPKDTALPVHDSNSNVYFIIVRGAMTLTLGEEEPHKYGKCFVNVPFGIRMNVQNKDDEILEFFVVKSPNPINYK